jgi:hypothetical protein
VETAECGGVHILEGELEALPVHKGGVEPDEICPQPELNPLHGGWLAVLEFIKI